MYVYVYESQKRIQQLPSTANNIHSSNYTLFCDSYTYISIHTHTHTHTHMCVYIYTYTYTHTHTHKHTHTHTHTHTMSHDVVCSSGIATATSIYSSLRTQGQEL